MRYRHERRDAGMTIAEVLVVVAIIGILLVVTIPNFTAFLRAYRAGTAVDQMVSMINAARQRAVTERETHLFIAFGTPQDRWEVRRGGTTIFDGELPDGVDITTGGVFLFNPNGACATPTGYTGTTPTSQFLRVEGTVTPSRTDRYTFEVSPVGRVKTTQEKLTS
ncbi:MAG: prepilin-type N-terminal cleavage/methylation domain-containing protein [Acidobacteriota bacterium]